MLLGIFFTYQVWIFICIFEASADWELSCYNESLHIHCDPEKTIIIHEAHFGYFREVLLISNSTNRCRAHNSRDCWVDVTANISRRCSGHSVCKTSVHYSSDLSADLLTRECPFIIDDAAEPTLFVEYDCIPTSMFGDYLFSCI
uniref:SUEL-type lectin domain-containing protein n=1 Tax=Schistosoma mansoni TaxID=6183 RepID=A0A5K4EPX8_SCHMA